MAEGKHLVGVDIGSSSVKVCQVRETRKGLAVTRLGYAQLAPQAIVDGQIMDAGAVVETLQRVLREARIKQREIALSVSAQNVIIRKITVPMMTAGELDEQIQWEAEQHIPFDIRDVTIDYQVLGRRPELSQMELLLVAAKREQISDFTQLARDAKLRPVVCDIDPFTIQNLFEATRPDAKDRTTALLCVGAGHTSVNVISRGGSLFTREIATGGNLVTAEIQKRLAVPQEQAEAYKCGGTPGDIVPEDVAKAIEEVVDTIAAEIQRSLDFFMATSGDAAVEGIYVTGGSSRLPGLADAITRRARVRAELWSPTAVVQVEGQAEAALLSERGPQFAVSLGLGLRREKETRAA